MQDLIQLLQSSQLLFLSAVFIVSLLIGSALNVIIYRLPNILLRDWRKQCYEFLETEIPENERHTLLQHKHFNELFFYPSHCLHCNRKIKPYDNIPLLSYLILRGKCRACRKKISMQYPLVEGLAAILATAVALRFGVSWQTLAGCMLTYVLIIQASIDLRHTIIPDEITLPMIWIGLLLSIPLIFVNSTTAIIGAISGYLFLWAIYWIFYWTTKKEGMGYGDFKLFAMLGAWLGWQILPFTILFSSILGSVVGVSLILRKHNKISKRIPFGPFLAIAGWIALMYGRAINDWYVQYAGLC